MTSDVYDSDDARNASPRLQPIKVDYEPRVTPPPFLPEPESPDKPSSGGGDRKDARRRRKKTQPSHRDVLILRSLADPQLANEIGENPLATDSSPESSSPDDYYAPEGTGKGRDASIHDVQRTAQHALDFLSREDTPTEPPQPLIKRESLLNEDPTAPTGPPKFLEPQAPPPQPHSPIDKVVVNGTLLKKLPRSSIPESQPHGRGKETIATSHTLRDYTISTSDCAAGETLPALQTHLESTCANSPENSQNLPSIGYALSGKGQLNGRLGSLNDASQRMYPSVTAPSPVSQGRNPQEPHTRRLSEQYIPPPLTSGSSSFLSPESSRDMSASLSPVAGPPQQPFWQHATDKGASYSHSPADPSPQFTDSPSTGYPTPTELGKSSCYNSPAQPNGISTSAGPLHSSGFKCNYPGCKSEPFQTQYLLNSHANVHSQNRPYYCPVRGCPRSEGGKGFKRKNEMKRHGLVHDSPGYVCPFCPDQQHTYPRPDNLQRHVRVHHVDKDREDPELRRVLAQRPEGGMRGRRRRNGT
ncbi:hypothetical protein AJ79_02038 [Helicocarpus griseus UAMH5409]|uniref:C2H2-type domain-containing protein n=1 Tax=Helicocarpus griseus UAMH5409 TaxID=1447875 RepID=A0A2B7Y572_9EURO|nr:hypothetical protein AJ79_02038 [Helicocarpus griseus UAMH5409]